MGNRQLLGPQIQRQANEGRENEPGQRGRRLEIVEDGSIHDAHTE
jgi:hypothetical protein